jgi:ABC-type transporter Mla subunit MlaD
MNFLSNWDRKLMFLSLAVTFGFLSHLIWTTDQTEKRLAMQASASLSQSTEKLNQTLGSINSAVQKLDDTLGTVNRPCGGGQPCGTLADFTKTLNTARLTMGQIEIAANHEDKNLTLLDSQEATFFGDVHGTVTTANTLLATTNAGMQTEFPNLEKTTTDFDAFIQSPDFTGSVHNLDVITGNLGQTTGDFQKKFHDVLFPPPCTNWKCHLKEDWGIIRGTLELLEPAYYGSQLIH